MPVLNLLLTLLRLLCGWGLALLLAVSPAHADDLKPLANEAMMLSGTRAMLEGMGKMLEKQSANDPRAAKLGKRERAQILATLKSSFDGGRIAEDLTTALAGTHDRERLAAAVATMRDPQFRKITRITVAEGLLVTEQKLIAYAKTFEKTPPDPARVKLIQQLDAATDGSRILADIRYESAETLLGTKARPEDRANLAEMRKQIETSAQNEYVVSMLYIARKLDNAALEAYVKAHENEPMGWLSRQLGYGFQRAMVKAFGEMAQKMSALAPAQPK